MEFMAWLVLIFILAVASFTVAGLGYFMAVRLYYWCGNNGVFYTFVTPGHGKIKRAGKQAVTFLLNDRKRYYDRRTDTIIDVDDDHPHSDSKNPIARFFHEQLGIFWLGLPYFYTADSEVILKDVKRINITPNDPKFIDYEKEEKFPEFRIEVYRPNEIEGIDGGDTQFYRVQSNKLMINRHPIHLLDELNGGYWPTVDNYEKEVLSRLMRDGSWKKFITSKGYEGLRKNVEKELNKILEEAKLPGILQYILVDLDLAGHSKDVQTKQQDFKILELERINAWYKERTETGRKKIAADGDSAKIRKEGLAQAEVLGAKTRENRDAATQEAWSKWGGMVYAPGAFTGLGQQTNYQQRPYKQNRGGDRGRYHRHEQRQQQSTKGKEGDNAPPKQ